MRVGQDSDLHRYARSLAQRGELRLDNISSEGLRRLDAEGIHRADLERIAGDDRVIRGEEFEQIFRLLEGRGTDRAGRTINLDRAQRVYESLERALESDRTSAAAIGSSSGAGLRDELRRTGRGGAARPEITYAANELPDVRADRESPSEPCWFIKMLEFLFSWIPGVSTDNERLQQYGRDLVDRHESDVRAFYDAYDRQTAAGPTDITGRRVGNPHAAMVSHIADRLQAEHGISRQDAERRAETIVNAMEQRLEERAEASGARAGEIRGLRDTTSGNARRLATRYFAARDAAQSLGSAWTRRLDQAMAAPRSDHPVLQANPNRLGEAENAVREENVKSVSYLMALQRAGQLSNVPSDAIDGLLAAQRDVRIDAEAVAETANALQSMPAAERSRLLTAIRNVPEDRRDLAWATLAREHIGLRSSDPAQRAASLERVTRAADQLRGMDVAAARTAFDQGTLGLIEDRVQVRHNVGGRATTTDVPVFFHPGVPEDRRDHYEAMIAESYGMVPRPALQAMLRGEGGRPFHVQVLPESSMHSGVVQQERPSRESPLGGFFRADDNLVRLNMHELDRAEASPDGRNAALGYILHESSHYLDDLGNADQRQGFFIDHDAGRANGRTEGDGDLAPAWAHFDRTRARHHELTEDLDQPLAREYFMLGRRDNRTEREEQRFRQLERHFAALSGTVSSYGAHGGDHSVRSRGVNLAEWFAETNANYLNPARRDHLRSVDPVGYQMAARYNELSSRGVSAQDALRQAARFSLSTEVSAQQGVRMLESAGSNPLTADQRRDLAGITEAFEQHATALDGWRPYRNDAGLRAMRKDEALAGVREGRALIAKLDERLAGLDRRSQEYRDLTALRARLDTAITRLETNANRL